MEIYRKDVKKYKEKRGYIGGSKSYVHCIHYHRYTSVCAWWSMIPTIIGYLRGQFCFFLSLSLSTLAAKTGSWKNLIRLHVNGLSCHGRHRLDVLTPRRPSPQLSSPPRFMSHKRRQQPQTSRAGVTPAAPVYLLNEKASGKAAAG